MSSFIFLGRALGDPACGRSGLMICWGSVALEPVVHLFQKRGWSTEGAISYQPRATYVFSASPTGERSGWLGPRFKPEARSSNTETRTKYSKKAEIRNKPSRFGHFAISVIRNCFGFRASIFGFRRRQQQSSSPSSDRNAKPGTYPGLD